MGKVGLCSYIFHNAYIYSSASVAGLKEKEGPLGKYFDKTYDSMYPNDKSSYEKSEISMIEDSLNIALSKKRLKESDVCCCIGGDLNNQIAATSYALRDYNIPYIGIFAACSTMTLSILTGCFLIEGGSRIVACCSSSHNGTSERQFRYPTEYGVQRSDTFTTTVIGSGTIILSNEITNLKVTKGTIGKVIDCEFKDVQDMGSAMAPAAYSTIKHHLNDFNLTVDDYDLICTGDLSKYGSQLLIDLFKEDGVDISNVHNDAGLLIFDAQTQDVWSGGSGCGCISVVLSSYLIDKLNKKEYKKILVCATGALMNPVMMGQKETIPAISHAISIEVV